VARNAAHLTQKMLADLLKVSQDAIDGAEQGDSFYLTRPFIERYIKTCQEYMEDHNVRPEEDPT